MSEVAGFDIGDHALIGPTGFEHCIVGVLERANQDPFLVYDKDRVLGELQLQGMTYDEAIEHFEHNMLGAFVGHTTPGFITLGGFDG